MEIMIKLEKSYPVIMEEPKVIYSSSTEAIKQVVDKIIPFETILQRKQDTQVGLNNSPFTLENCLEILKVMKFLMLNVRIHRIELMI
jgi:hypothetical protein